MTDPEKLRVEGDRLDKKIEADMKQLLAFSLRNLGVVKYETFIAQSLGSELRKALNEVLRAAQQGQN
jgi:hypothetical protein